MKIGVLSCWAAIFVLFALSLPACSAGTAKPNTTGPAVSPVSTVAQTPPMGWNSWNSIGCGVTESIVRGVADAMVSSGMRDAGYTYVVVDDCWVAPQRAADGSLQSDPTRFPSGMKALADYVHSRGLKFGIYSVPGPLTCAQRSKEWPGATGSLGHETQDANTFASWGVDYLKYDLCTPPSEMADPYGAFIKMRDALRATGRPIVYSINPNSDGRLGAGTATDWSHVANMWRIDSDIIPKWDTFPLDMVATGVLQLAFADAPLTTRAGPGHWNDPDMLEVGATHLPGDPNAVSMTLSPDEARSHFTIWSMLAAPLLAGNDPRDMPTEIRDILTNARVIAIDQDRLGRQATLLQTSEDSQIWLKQLSGGGVAVALINLKPATAQVNASWVELGINPSRYKGQELWTGSPTPTGTTGLSFMLPSHGSALVRLDPVPG